MPFKIVYLLSVCYTGKNTGIRMQSTDASLTALEIIWALLVKKLMQQHRPCMRQYATYSLQESDVAIEGFHSCLC